MRILIAGFQHETNTFAPSKADWAAFNRGVDFPAFMQGDAVIQRLTGINIPTAGFIDFAAKQGWQLKPSIWTGATPSAHITDDAFERICAPILKDAATLDFDAIYLDLHGAAVAEHCDDCEGELLRRLRSVVGPDIPIVVSLDSHANVTTQMFALADALTCYRTYPHIDMAATGTRAGELLQARVVNGKPLALTVRRIPFLIALNAQSTMTQPCADVMNQLHRLEQSANQSLAPGQASLNFATGFPAADIDQCGPVVWGYGPSAKNPVNELADTIESIREQWRVTVKDAAESVSDAITLALQTNNGPVVIADTQDNPGAGGDSNTTGMLHALLSAGAGKHFPNQVAIGLIYDIEAGLAAHRAGIGSTITLSVGKSVNTGWQGMSEPPVSRKFKVKHLSDGKLTLKGPMMTGLKVELGASALLECEGVLVCVAGGKTQMLDRELYRCLGVTPESMKILVNKSSVHFRADFAPIASHILVAKSPGPMAASPADLPWTKLNPSTQKQP